MWQHAAILGSLSVEGIAMLWPLQLTRADSIASLSRTIDCYLRSPAFLRLMKCALTLANNRSYFVLFPIEMPRKESER